MGQLDSICANLNKQLGAELITKGVLYQDIPRIRFSSERLNHMTYGGFPRGFMAEFYGDNGGGKTSTALDLLGNAQKQFKAEYEAEMEELQAIKNPNAEQKKRYAMLQARGPLKCVFIDAENTFDREWSTKLGVDCDDIYLFSPENQGAEEILEIVLTMAECGEVGFLVVDSIGALYSLQEKEKSLSEKVYCGVAGILTRFSKKITRFASKYKMAVIMINQVREDIDCTYGIRLKTTGGKAFKHHCALRMMFMKGEYLDDKNAKLTSGCESPCGNIVKVHIEKTKKFAPNRKEGFYTLNYFKGIDKLADLIDVCMLHDLIVRNGAYYTLMDTDGNILTDEEDNELKFQGKASLYEFIESTPVMENYLKECLAQIK